MGNVQGIYNFFSLRSGNRITSRQLIAVCTPTIVLNVVAAMDLSVKRNKGIIFEDRTGVTVNTIMQDEKSNELYYKIDRNIIGVD